MFINTLMEIVTSGHSIHPEKLAKVVVEINVLSHIIMSLF